MEDNLNPMERTIGLFIEPRKVMLQISDKPDLFLPFLITIFSALFGIPVEAQYQEILGMVQPELPGFLVGVSAIFSALLGWIIIAAVYLLLTRILGGVANYRHMLSLSGYLAFITLVANLIRTSAATFTGQVISLGPAILLPLEERLYSPVGAFLERFDLLYLFSLVLLALGFMYIARLSQTKAIALVGFFWLFGTVFSVLGALIL